MSSLSDHGTTNRWRTGCRCDRCNTAHLADLRQWRRVRAEQAFPPQVRRRLLNLVGRGNSPAAAAAALKIPVQRVHAWSRVDEGWPAELDAALMAGRRADVPHGTETGYRHHRCRCPECRRAHHPTA